MGRIWLEVPFIHLVPVAREVSDLFGDFTGGFRLHLGDAMVLPWQITSRPGKDRWFSQNHGCFRFLDSPFHHKEDHEYRGDESLLMSIVPQQVYYLCHGRDGCAIRLWVEDGGVPPVIEPFYPPDWGAKNLRIPVDFVSVRAWRAGMNEAYRRHIFADVRIGHHFVFWHQMVFDPLSQNPVGMQSEWVLDSRVREAVNALLAEYSEDLARMSAEEYVGIDTGEGWVAMLETVAPRREPEETLFPCVEFV